MIQNLDPSKTHDHKIISICKLKMCSFSICKSLEFLSKQYVEHGGKKNDNYLFKVIHCLYFC